MTAEEKLKESAGKLLDFVEKSGDFVVEQAPLYVQELVEYHFIQNLVPCIASLIGFLALISIALWGAYKINKKDTSRWEIEWMPISIGYALLLITIGFLTSEITYHVTECYKAKYAPRVLIIEKLNNLR